ncbi:hypothetical protein OHA27_01255 [Streptomyces sp. NBC_01619]|uniref:Uncharacterized protein n=1 Tax=Streptomyces pratisoli TaxID=3139917 RepID=A0ACC6QG42_9ACTN|nr:MULTISPECIES: hypothetical protein [unclassified Streptomyces]MCX4508948.1 hypothetical protein [Streptomyces sp. NBC_01619]
MADGQESEAYRCGRLWAALHTLRSLGGGRDRRKLAAPDEVRQAEKQPHIHIPRQLDKIGGHFLAARKRGAEHGKAADALVRTALDLLPDGVRFPQNRTVAEQDDFRKGFHAGLSHYETTHRSLME